LTEGLAQYGEEHVAGTAPPNSRNLSLTPLPLRDLDRKFDDPVWQDYSYALARDVVAYLVEKYGAEKIPRLLDSLGQGYSLEQAFTQTLGVGVDEFLEGYRGSRVE